MYCSWDSDRIGGNGGFPIGKKNIHRRYTEYYKMTELIVSCVTVCGPGWRHSPHAGVLQDTHDPLNPVHGHTLLETAESWKKKKVVPWATGAVLTAGTVESAKHMGCVKCVCVCVWGNRLPASVARKCWVTQGQGLTKIPSSFQSLSERGTILQRPL